MIWTRQAPALLYALFLFSGAASLGLQMAWSRMLGLALGHELPAVLAVVAAFMGGMSLGAWMLDRRIRASPQPRAWYAGLELTIGAWGLLSAWLIPRVNHWAPHLLGIDASPAWDWTASFLTPLMLLLPATVAMGGTLPAMERWLAPLHAQHRCVGAVYAANTLGAVAGTLFTVFLVLPAFGFRQSVCLLAAINLACGTCALILPFPLRSSTPLPSSVISPLSSRLSILLFATGCLGIAYEIVGVQILSQVLENTTYTFAAVLGVYLLGTASGAALYQWRGERWERSRLLTHLLGGLAVATLAGVLLLSQAAPVYARMRALLGDGPGSVLAAEMVVALLGFGLPTCLMGATFSHLVQWVRSFGGGVGGAAALNTLGGALAPLLFGVVLMPAFGLRWTMLILGAGYLLLFPRWSRGTWAWAAAAVLVAVPLPSPEYWAQPPSSQARLATARQGVRALVTVWTEPDGHRTLRVNNRFQMGGTAAAGLESRQAHVPLLLHPAPRRALLLGAGTGITLGAASLHPDLRAEGVELLPEVVEVMPRFAPENFDPTRHPSLRVVTADARRFVRATTHRYDVIIADLFHPALDGAGALYTLEHFTACRSALAPGGLFCQWLPLHQLDLPVLQMIVRTFLEAFPNAEAWLLHYSVDTPVLGLVGRLNPHTYASQWLEPRLAHIPLATELRKLSLADSLRLFGFYFCGPTGLQALGDGAPLNTDDHPHVAFRAPLWTYRKHAEPFATLLALLDRLPQENGEFPLAEPDAGDFRSRWRRYLAARDTYLQGRVAEARGRQSDALDAFVESARLCDDFTFGYSHTLAIAAALVRSQPQAARALLERLAAAQPHRPAARELLLRLNSY